METSRSIPALCKLFFHQLEGRVGTNEKWSCAPSTTLQLEQLLNGLKSTGKPLLYTAIMGQCKKRQSGKPGVNIWI